MDACTGIWDRVAITEYSTGHGGALGMRGGW